MQRFSLYPQPRTCVAFPIPNIPTGVTFFTIDEPTWTHYYHPESVVYMDFFFSLFNQQE